MKTAHPRNFRLSTALSWSRWDERLESRTKTWQRHKQAQWDCEYSKGLFRMAYSNLESAAASMLFLFKKRWCTRTENTVQWKMHALHCRYGRLDFLCLHTLSRRGCEWGEAAGHVRAAESRVRGRAQGSRNDQQRAGQDGANSGRSQAPGSRRGALHNQPAGGFQRGRSECTHSQSFIISVIIVFLCLAFDASCGGLYRCCGVFITILEKILHSAHFCKTWLSTPYVLVHMEEQNEVRQG